jgi:hypothetical protein
MEWKNSRLVRAGDLSGVRFSQCVRLAGLWEKMKMKNTINTSNTADAE